MEELESLELYRMCADFAKAWNRRVAKGEKGENVVYKALIEAGYQIITFPIKKEGEISLKRKKQKKKEQRFPDALALYKGESEPPFKPNFFLDVKYKSKSEHLGVVNVLDYDGYVSFLRYFTVQIQASNIITDVPFKIFFYIEDAKGIWTHDLRDPHSEPSLIPTICILGLDEVYQLFPNELKFWRRVVYT